MDDIVSQGGDRGPSRWPRRAAAIAALLLVAVLIVAHLPLHPRPAAQHGGAAATGTPTPLTAIGADLPRAGVVFEPGGVSGQILPWDASLRLPVAGEQPAWLWPATGRTKPIGGLQPDGSGYQFVRIAGGWAVQASPGAQLSCGSCAGQRRAVYFLGDNAQTVTPIGTANAIAPGAAAGAVWLTSYPPGADMSSSSGTAQEVSTAGAPLGSELSLPAGYVIDRATDAGLLLTQVTQRPGTTSDILWNPLAPHASRTFDGVIAASASEIAWTTRRAQLCRVHVLDLATGRHTVVALPGVSSADNGAFSPDGTLLALQVGFYSGGDDGALAMQLDVASLASGRLTAVKGTFSSDALTGFGWPTGRDDLVTELSFTTKVQVVLWRPGASRLAVAAIRSGPDSASLIVGFSVE